MNKTWMIGQHHFRKEVSKKSFLFVLLSLPFFLSLTIGLGSLFDSLENDSISIGYIDKPRYLKDLTLDDYDNVQLTAYTDEGSARAALESGNIEAYFVLPANYPSSIDVELKYLEELDPRTYGIVRVLTQQNLLADQPSNVVEKLMSGPEVTVEAIESKREYPGGGPQAETFLPVLAAIMFGFLTMTTSGYMLAAVVEEKENRTMEILLSSISPSQLMTGKIIGALGIAFVQLTVWVLFFGAVIWFGGNLFSIGWLQDVRPNYLDIAKLIAIAVPSYLFFSALMTLVGASLVDTTEAEQVGPLAFLLILIPLYLIVAIAGNPNGALALTLTFIPLTSVLTFSIRTIFMEVPIWQVSVASGIGLVSALIMTWFAGKAFRLMLLRYGQRLSLVELIRGRSSKPNQRPDNAYSV